MNTIDFKEVQGFKTWWAWAGIARIECAVPVCYCTTAYFG